jgi:4-diphosphocytidyl-2-C-methyl-D-erythritol kinase
VLQFSKIKINLGLNITSRLANGYHTIESLFYPLNWGDSIEIFPSDELRFFTYGISIPGNPDQNLCLKAFQLLVNDFSIPPVNIHLLKNVPTGAGLGGGSADGALTLKMLNSLFELNINNSKLAEYALKLGSDCPFFIYEKPALINGTGELISAIDFSLKGYEIALIKPDIHIDTKFAYSLVTPQKPETELKSLLQQPVESWNGVLKNDFETALFPTFRVLADIKSMLLENGALYASLSGSGATVYGIFKQRVELDFASESVIIKWISG